VDAEQDEKAPVDAPGDASVDGHGGRGDPLDDGAHQPILRRVVT
jgi:hypothetical protein